MDTIRRFFADQAIESGRISLLFLVNFVAIWYLDWWLALMSIIILPVVMVISILFFKRIEKSLHQISGAGSQGLLTLTGKSDWRACGQSLCAAKNTKGKSLMKSNWERYQRGKWLLLMHALYWPTTDIMCGAQMLKRAMRWQQR